MIKTILTCDHCKKPPNTITLDGPYMIAKKEMKELDWRNIKVGEEWKIKCPECGKAEKDV